MMRLSFLLFMFFSLSSFANEIFSGIGPLEVKKVLSFKASTADSNTEAVFRVKTQDGFLKTLTCTLPQGAKEPIKRVKILDRDQNQPQKIVYFCIGSAE